MLPKHKKELEFVTSQKPERGEILKTVVFGSYAYGTNHKESDLDVRGIFVVPTQDLLKFEVPSDEFTVGEEYDAKWLEIQKFLKLLMKGDAAPLEILYLKDPGASPYLATLNNHHNRFYGKKGVYQCYWGRAGREKRLAERDWETYLSSGHEEFKRKALKCMWHGVRFLLQGTELLLTGKLDVRMERGYIDLAHRIRKEKVEWSFLLEYFDTLERQFNAAYEASPLNSEPDFEFVENYLLYIRAAH